MARSARLGVLVALVLAVAPTARAGDVSVRLDAGSGFSLKDGTGTIERLRIDEATGNVSRNGALFVHTTGVNNLFMGRGAGNAGTTGYGSNAAFGVYALSGNSSGSTNAAFGYSALRFNTTGSSNTGVGAFSLRSNTTGIRNTAAGFSALRNNSTGSANTAVGFAALNFNFSGASNVAVGYYAMRNGNAGSRNTAVGRGALLNNGASNDNAAVGFNALTSNTVGVSNAAFGAYALSSSSSGYWNSALGESALRYNSNGPQNSAFGKSALRNNTTGAGNSAVGSYALRDNTSGDSNVGFGQTALRLNTTGSDNAAFGRGALYTNTAGSRNVAVGLGAGNGQTTGNDNIYLASFGVAGESGQIRIGTPGSHTQAQVAGIHGATSSGGVGVLVNANGVLGTTTSSARFKKDVEDLGDASDLLMRLRPVRFHYLEEAVGAEESRVAQYGLIAEEVAEVAPELVAPDAEGRPYSVKYHVLPALLVNGLQKEHRANAEQQRTIDVQRELIATLSARLAALEARAAR